MNIRLHIERVVVEGMGLTSVEAASVLTAMEAELSALLAAGGVNPSFQSDTALASISVGAIGVEAGSGADALGRRVAGALYGGIAR